MNRIKEIRMKHGATQIEMAEVAGVSQRAVSQWETGKTDPSALSISRIAEKYGEDAESIVWDGAKKEPQNSVELTAAEKRLIDVIRGLPEDRRDVACLMAELSVRGKIYRDLIAKLDEVADMAERIMGNGNR